MERYMIVGLGNPGKKYENTRHNIGFMTVDALAKDHALKFDGKQAQAQVADGVIAGKRVLLVKPQTYMNLSGQAVRALADFYKITPERIAVVYDDMDIDLGILRIRSKGGAGGHNGIKSLIAHLANPDFTRIRFGVGRPPGRMDPAAYVLLPFKTEEHILVIETIARAQKTIATWLTEGIEIAMNRYNGTADEVAERQRKMSNPKPSAPASSDPTNPTNT